MRGGTVLDCDLRFMGISAVYLAEVLIDVVGGSRGWEN